MLYIQAFAMLASLATATNFQAWSGGDCNGSAGRVVTLSKNGNCIAVDGRHSWQVNGDNVKGYYYSSGSCQGASTRFNGNNGACNNINTGSFVGSMCVVGAGNPGCGL